ncbi:hypothetical protein K488DRAFT_92485 [Vararia minispora EC-137]|uniref:Uncharacterized protein n=1 Tax=Vararia minispora EC-137 TaxID=1314806 RepID=A0ACB8Q433_9AGAM|nr:hypothetical protein K488DRAFT_92485 [Vararia minispora EC-137]
MHHWATAIKLFQFDLQHVLAERYRAPDGLSRRLAQPEDVTDDDLRVDDDDFDDWVDRMYGRSMYLFNPVPEQDRLLALLPSVLDQSRGREAFSEADWDWLLRLTQYYWQSPDGRLWHKSPDFDHRLVIGEGADRYKLLKLAHDDSGHHSFWATYAVLSQRFYWPGLQSDILWYVKTCHDCQACSFDHVVAARCSLSSFVEAKMLRKAEMVETVGEFLYQMVVTRWGALREIVTDNGTPWITGLFRPVFILE